MKTLRNIYQFLRGIIFGKLTYPKWNIFPKVKPTEQDWYQCTIEVPNQQRYIMNLYWYPSTERFIDNIRKNVCETYDVIGYSGKKLDDIGQDRTNNVITWTKLPKPYMDGFVYKDPTVPEQKTPYGKIKKS
jgi:hypothetical protein